MDTSIGEQLGNPAPLKRAASYTSSFVAMEHHAEAVCAFIHVYNFEETTAGRCNKHAGSRSKERRLF